MASMSCSGLSDLARCLENRGTKCRRLFDQRLRGFTLVELLVVISIITILISLLLPAVQAAREAARRSSCANNMKQLGLALHNYHSARKTFPPGAFFAEGHQGKWGPSWITMLLPSLEQSAIFDQIDFKKGMVSQAILQNQVNVLLCPTDVRSQLDSQYGMMTNYAGNIGLGTYRCRWTVGTTTPALLNSLITKRGMFRLMLNTSMRDVKDGSSNTIMVAEIRRTGGTDRDSRGVANAPCGPLYMHNFSPNDAETVNADAVWQCNNLLEVPCVGKASNNPYRMTARSRHSGGLNVTRADGSVSFMKETISLVIWKALSTCRGQEVVSQ